jgi:hypothetical protein
MTEPRKPDDREILDDLSKTLSREEYNALDNLAAGLRRRATPLSLQINNQTGEMISPSGLYGDDELPTMEREYRESVERYKIEFAQARLDGRLDGPPAA